MSGTPTFGRYSEIPIDQMTPEQREGYRFLVDGPRGRLPGPYKVWVNNPKLVHAAAPLGQHFTPGQSSLTEREREIDAAVDRAGFSARSRPGLLPGHRYLLHVVQSGVIGDQGCSNRDTHTGVEHCINASGKALVVSIVRSQLE